MAPGRPQPANPGPLAPSNHEPKISGRRPAGRRLYLTVLRLSGLAPSPDVATILNTRAAKRRPGFAQRQTASN